MTPSKVIPFPNPETKIPAASGSVVLSNAEFDDDILIQADQTTEPIKNLADIRFRNSSSVVPHGNHSIPCPGNRVRKFNRFSAFPCIRRIDQKIFQHFKYVDTITVKHPGITRCDRHFRNLFISALQILLCLLKESAYVTPRRI